MEHFLKGGNEEEQSLLEILRGSDNIAEIKRACHSLAKLGTIYSLPVLAARSADTTEEMKETLCQTVEQIGVRHNVPKDLWNSLSDPDQWKNRWNGPPESFLAFVEMFSMTMTNEPKTGAATDRLGEIFLKVIDVDLSPYESFHELRICSTGDHLQKFAQRITDHLQSQVVVNDLLDDVSINFIRPEIDQEVYKALQMDYFITRMQQYLKFANE